MQRIDGSTAAPSMPAIAAASGTPGYFTGGNPAGPTPATVVTPDWLNMVQEELVAVIIGAGLALKKSDTGQLFAAIQTLIASGGVAFATDTETVAGTVSNKAVSPRAAAALTADRIAALVAGAPAALNTLAELAVAVGNNPNFATDVTTALAARALVSQQIVGAGLASGGGDLTEDRTITVPAASGTELNAGTDATKALTPAAFATAGGGDGSTGWAPLPGGNMIQWGSIAVVGNGTSKTPFSIVFPRPFLNVCGSVVGTCDPYTDADPALVINFRAPSIAGVSGIMNTTNSSNRLSNARTLRWQAIGR